VRFVVQEKNPLL